MTNETILASFENHTCHALVPGYEEVEVYLQTEACRHVSVKSMCSLESELRECGFAVRTVSHPSGARTVTVSAPVADAAAFSALKTQVARLVRAHLGIACLVPESSTTIH